MAKQILNQISCFHCRNLYNSTNLSNSPFLFSPFFIHSNFSVFFFLNFIVKEKERKKCTLFYLIRNVSKLHIQHSSIFTSVAILTAYFNFCLLLICFSCNHQHHHLSSFTWAFFAKQKDPYPFTAYASRNTKKRTVFCSLNMILRASCM